MMISEKNLDWFTLEQAAKIRRERGHTAGVTRDVLAKMIQKGKFPFRRLGNLNVIHIDDIDYPVAGWGKLKTRKGA